MKVPSCVYVMEDILHTLQTAPKGMYSLDGRPMTAEQAVEAAAIHHAAMLWLDATNDSEAEEVSFGLNSVLWTIELHKLETMYKKAYA